MPVDTTARVNQLRDLMSKEGVDAYVIKSEDAHSSEYISPTDARRSFISGFTGSAGTAVVTKDEALLFTDGRYFLQAGKELGPNWKLMKILPSNPVNWDQHLKDTLRPNSKIGFDPLTFTIGDVNSITSPSISLVPIQNNLVDEVWIAANTKPPRPAEPIVVLGKEISGKGWEEKVAELRNEAEKEGAKALVVGKLDEVAWLFNLRGSDVTFNPVFFSYALIPTSSGSKPTLFLQPPSITLELKAHLGDGVVIKSYQEVLEILKDFSSSLSASEKVLFDSTTSHAIWNCFKGENRLLTRSQIEVPKAIKNDVELEGFRHCHVRDGAALTSYFAWLEEELLAGKSYTESQGADKLESIRSGQKNFRGLSFDTISSTGPNASIIHYRPDPPTCPVIDPSKIYLCDSGAQYLDGTTDVTRTLHFKEPTKFEKRAFTRVLQGHIEIAKAVWPEGITGYRLDALARRALWKDGLDYRHGTGHGVGHYLNVHEGPAGIGFRKSFDTTPLLPGMVLSNEPGFYADDSFGIRIENLVAVKVVSPPHAGEFDKSQRWLGFENLTWCPLGRKLIEVGLLSGEEKQWVNWYHAQCLEKLGPELDKMGDARGKKWLEKECKPLEG